jgi:hypothetical protein
MQTLLHALSSCGDFAPFIMTFTHACEAQTFSFESPLLSDGLAFFQSLPLIAGNFFLSQIAQPFMAELSEGRGKRNDAR